MKKRIKTIAYRMLAVMVSLILIVGAFPAAVYLAAGGQNIAVIVNGDFENGNNGFENIDAATYEVIAEVGNTSNHVLHLKGAGKFKQTISVEKNTDYIWTLRMKKLDDQGPIYFDAIAEDGTTNLVTAVSSSSAGAYTNMYNQRAAVDINNGLWGTFVFKFNSGNNASVELMGDTWDASRELYTDDWTLEKVPEPGELVNGDMENGTKGYVNAGTATFENIVDPDNASNHILHLVGGGSYYQTIAVEKNTDYVWTFKMKDIGNTESTRILVYPENGTDNLITAISQSGGGYASLNDGTYSSAATYNKVWVTFTVKFNSGDNESVKLYHNTWAATREIYMDDWTLAEVPKVGAIVNGSFDKDTKGYTNMNTATFEVIAEPGNTANSVLHLIGDGNYYQQVPVAKNTDYIWTFKMKDIGNIDSTRIYVHPETDSSNLITEISQSGGGYASLNDGTYASVATYNKAWVTFTVKFNSGDNESVKLLHNTWATTREIYMDDWELALENKGDIINGNFENDTTGFVSDGVLKSFKVIAEPGNTTNHVLEVGGTTAGKYWQEIKVEENTDYIWSFKAKRVSGSGREMVAVTPADSTTSLVKGITKKGNGATSMWNNNAYFESYDGEWVTYEVTFNSGENTLVRLTHNAGSGNPSRKDYMDDWKLSKPRAAGELLNGGFDEGTKYYDNENTVIFEAITDPENGNNKLLHAGDGGKFSQTVIVTPNTNYVWSFRMKSLDSAGNIYADVVQSDNTIITGSVSHIGATYATMYNDRAAINANANWATFSIRFNSGTNTEVKLQIDTWAVGRDRYFDDWKLKVAAPTGEFLNGDFEQSNLSAYDCDKFTTAEHTDEVVHGGNGAAVVSKDETDGNGFFYQSISVEKNTDYIWRFWVRFNNNNSPVGATVKKTGGANLPSRIDGDCDAVVEPSPVFDFHRIRYDDAEWHEYEIFFSTGDSQAVDLILVVYKAGAELFTDDWTLEKIGTTLVSDTLIDVDFEHDNMGCHEITKPCWTVTDEQAHGGTKSIKYDGSTSTGPLDLLYLDKYGVIADTVGVEENTKYRFSFWYKGEGDRLDMANVTFKLYSGGQTYHCTNIYTNGDTEWKYAEHIFDSGDKKGFRLLLHGMILGSRKFNVFVDDIKLEKINVGVNDTAISPDEVTCTDEQNLIPAGSNTVMNSGFENIQKLTLTPYGIYNFKATYTADAANGKIGIAVDENGTPLTSGKSIIAVTDTNGQSASTAFTFTAPEDGIVYLVTANAAGTASITDLVLYAVNPPSQIPVEKVVLNNPTKNDKVSIWDQDFDFDFDWNNEFEDTEITEPEEEEVVTGKRYQRIKKRKLISKGTSGISTTAVVLVCVGAAVILAAAATFVIIIICRKKRRKV